MPFWSLPHSFYPSHLPLLTYNRCSLLDLMGNFAELTTIDDPKVSNKREVHLIEVEFCGDTRPGHKTVGP